LRADRHAERPSRRHEAAGSGSVRRRIDRAAASPYPERDGRADDRETVGVDDSYRELLCKRNPHGTDLLVA